MAASELSPGSFHAQPSAKPPSLPQHLGPADVCSPPFSPPKSNTLAAQRSGEVPGLSLASGKLHQQGGHGAGEPGLPQLQPWSMPHCPCKIGRVEAHWYMQDKQ